MFDSSSSRLTATHLLIPISLLSFTVALLFAFQSGQILRDRDALHQAFGQQQAAFADSQKLQGQLNALVTGTQKLADQGNKHAKVVADRLKELGVIAAPAQSSQAPVPAATEKVEPGPVKP